MLERFNAWLKVEARGWRIARLFLPLFGAMIVWIICSATLLQSLGYEPPQDPIGIKLGYTLDFLQLVVVLAFVEELLFRFPLLLAVYIERSVTRTPLVLITSVLLSAIFGLMHGGIENILTQGGLGFFFSVFFLKCGGYQFRFVKALLASTALHASWNLFIFSMLMSAGVTEI